jgi:uncharacterized protein YjbK
MEYETEDYKVRDFEGVTVVRLKNPNLTGLLEVTRIGEELKALIDGGVRKLVMDFKHVKHCGSSALGLLIAIDRKMRQAKGLMVLSHPENLEETAPDFQDRHPVHDRPRPEGSGKALLTICSVPVNLTNPVVSRQQFQLRQHSPNLRVLRRRMSAERVGEAGFADAQGRSARSSCRARTTPSPGSSAVDAAQQLDALL